MPPFFGLLCNMNLNLNLKFEFTVLGLSFCLSVCLSCLSVRHAILAVRVTKSITKDFFSFSPGVYLVYTYN